jgi:hypothetical protein
MATWIMVGACVVLIVVVVIGRIIEVRGRPQCPYHPGPAMELVDDIMGNEEFICRTKGCNQCATREPSGRVSRYTT